MSSSIKRSPSSERPTPLIPPQLQFRPVEHPVLPIQKEPDVNGIIKTINETWIVTQKLMHSMHQQQINAFKRQHQFEMLTNDQLESMQKDMNLLRGHINKSIKQFKEIHRDITQLGREFEVGDEFEHEKDKSQSVDQPEAGDSRQAQVHTGDDRDS